MPRYDDRLAAFRHYDEHDAYRELKFSLFLVAFSLGAGIGFPLGVLYAVIRHL